MILLVILLASFASLTGCYHSQGYVSEDDFAVTGQDETDIYRYHAEYVQEKYETRRDYQEKSYVINDNPDLELDSENPKGYTGNFYYKGPGYPESYSTRDDTVYSGYIPGYYGSTYYSAYPYYPLFFKRNNFKRHYGKGHSHYFHKEWDNAFDRW
jgi:hypothetical protein